MSVIASPRATIIISVYNNLDFLRLVLAGFMRQTEKDFEIIVSDDGSSESFARALATIIATLGLRITHNRHADEGFRKNKILNSSIRKSQAGYLIFIDGDCIPHPEFVHEHLSESAPGYCLVGRRMDLSARLTKRLTPDKVAAGYLQSSSAQLLMLKEYLGGGLKNFKNGIYVRNPLLRRVLK